jgi:hypothetical protein
MSENTGTEVQVVEEPRYEEITEPSTGSLRRLEAEALAMDKAVKLARGLSATRMVPEHFQQGKNGEQATWDLAAAILYGAELGLSAPQSAQNIFVVKGKPAVYARTMAAQVMHAGYKLEEIEASDQRVMWRAYRDTRTAESEWTIERAQQAGYTVNARYQSNPQEMLRAKCIAEVCRILFPDVLLGMAYTVEELQLENVTVQRVVKQGSRGTAKLREIADNAQARNGVVDGEPQDAEEVPPEPTVDVAEIRKLYKEHKGLAGTALLADLNEFLQRDVPVKAVKDITPEEAELLLAYLTRQEESVEPEGDGQ